MFDRAGLHGKALSFLIVWTMVLGAFFGLVASFAPAAQAGVCDQVSGVITGDWSISTAQTCTGVFYTVDGSITITGTGSLTLTDGGISFAKDGSHTGYSFTVNGDLVLDNSYVTTVSTAIDPYLHLAFTVSGAGSSLVMQDGAMLKFPGWFNASAGAVLNLTDSTITGFTNAELGGLFSDPAWTDLSNDAPAMVWSATTAGLYRSRIERLTEGADGPENLRLESGSALYAYDSYIGIDFSDDVAAEHNELAVDGTSNAYLYGVTIDLTESPAALSDYSPAFRPAAGGNVYLFRWLHAYVVDFSGTPVYGAEVWSRLSPGSSTATYPDSGTTTPTSRTLWYLGRAASGTNRWNLTDGYGHALIPLYTDQITSVTLPNAESFGNYEERAALGTDSTLGSVSFPAYPAIAEDDNSRSLTLVLSSALSCVGTTVTWSSARTLTGTVSVSGSVEVTAAVSVTGGGIYVDQQENGCAFVRVRSGGSLTLTNSQIWSNYPLVVDVASGGTLTMAGGSQLLLTQRGRPGALRSVGTGNVYVADSSVDGNVSLAGTDASLVRTTLKGPSVVIDTSGETVRIWDPVFDGVTDLALLTDGAAVDFDIRNATFDAALTSQLRFSGSQSVQLTSVSLYDPTGTWWQGMISGGAVVERYWWLTVRAVDGTGTVLANANVTIDLDKLDPATLSRVGLPNPAPDDIYFANTSVWRVGAPGGFIVYRALAEVRTSSPSGRDVDNTYIGNATAFLDGTTYYSDAENQASITADTTMDLEFSSLTPDLSVVSIRVTGGNGNSDQQPLNTPLTLIARVRNAGQIDVYNVMVSFFADNVDKNGDGLMDFNAADFRASAGIDDSVVAQIGKNSEVDVAVLWTPVGSVESSRAVSAVVDPPLITVDDDGEIRETNDRNNILSRTFTLFTWPDLSVTSADIVTTADAVVNNTVSLRVTVRNQGTNAATDAQLLVFDNGQPVPGTVTFDLARGAASVLTVPWRPTTVGNHTVLVRLESDNGTERNTDYIWTNNQASVILQVLTQPDLELRQTDFTTAYTPTQGQGFTVSVTIHNIGQTSASNISVAVYLDAARTTKLGERTGLNVRADDLEVTSVSLTGINSPGQRQLLVMVDPANALNEGGVIQESNNFANITVDVQPPEGEIVIELPASGVQIQPGQTLLVTGFVRSGVAAIPRVAVEIDVSNADGRVGNASAVSDDDGRFTALVPIRGDARDGSYTVTVTAPSSAISSATQGVVVRKIVPFLDQPVPLLGIPWWLFLVIVAAVAAILVGATLYYRFYGLGKMVECGECGAFIPEDATTCPKCGVEFEKDMAKCSNCQAWIPVDVKQCPECGVEFATGEVEMADYQEKMRLQYDEVVQKFKEEASRQLGRALSDREFQEWWRKQPTFVTFEDWLREEEEMRKMGSKPCPVCGTLNSVTATVCHKCGSLLKEQRPPGGAGGAPPPARKPAAAPAPPPTAPSEQPPGGAGAFAPAPGAAGPGTEAIPRRVIRKPIGTQPVVQKKVIRRPAEGQPAEGQEGEGQEQEKSEGMEDEL